MAEAIAVLGVAAAALQFAETGYKVISTCSFLMKRSREYPDYLHRTHSQVQHLIYLAKMAAENPDTSQAVASSQPQYAICQHSEQQFRIASNQPEPAAIISVQMETIWRDCAHQAEVIDKVLQDIMREIESKGLIGKWRQLSLHERVYSIERALGELERSKSTLGLWLGNESLYRMGRMHHDLAMMHDQIMHSERTFIRMFEEYQRKTENTVLAMGQPKPVAKSLDAKAYNKENENTQAPLVIDNQKAKIDLYSRTINGRASSLATPSPSIQDRDSNETKTSDRGRQGKDTSRTNTLLPNVVKAIDWSKMLNFAGNMIVLQRGSQVKKSHAFASEDDRNMFLNVYIRLRMNWLFDLVEMNFSLQQYPGNPSIRASLRAQIRVKSLPLQDFFFDIYGHRLYQKRFRRRVPSPEEQLQLFSTARKLLLEKFHAGDAIPNSINRYGQTLLHLQAMLYFPGYETLFTKMTEFLISMSVDTEVVDDSNRTAQNILWFCNIADRSKTVMPYDVVKLCRLTWTDNWGGRMGASLIVRTIQYWPEASLDIDHEQICDIVLRKSLEDLHNLRNRENRYLVWSKELTSPLHFAAAVAWPAGVETLISMGYSKFQLDVDGQSPLSIAIEVGCIPAVEALLRGDCQALFARKTRDDFTTLPWEFIKVADSDDNRLHDIIVDCLLRHRVFIPELVPYHDLSRRNGVNAQFAQRLYNAGFQEIEAYDCSGYTPLMVSCLNGNIRMASFLLQHGADPFKCHEDASLRAGHFLCYDGVYNHQNYRSFAYYNVVNEEGFRFNAVEKRLLEAAFNTSVPIGSRCRCSSDGTTPVTFLFQMLGHESTYDLKVSFQRMMRNVDFSIDDMKRHWRAFIVCETFNRLGLTHTCFKLQPRIGIFPDNRRIEIEAEEDELFFELEEIAARFDLFSDNRQDDLSVCVDEFFDDLDGDLRPWSIHGSVSMQGYRSPGCLGPSDSFFEDCYRSTRGELIGYNHKEIVEEESVLRWLFP